MAATADAARAMTVATSRASGLEGVLEAAESAFARATSAAGGCIDRLIRVAGRGARLCFAGSAMLEAVMPAIEHLETPGIAPSLTVLIWDARSTGVWLTPPDWADVPYFERGNVRGVQDERFTLAFDRRSQVFSAVDALRGMAVCWTRDTAAVPYLERAAPLRRVLQGWLHPAGLFLAHAAAVGHPSGGVLLGGGSGSGKSTTAALCLQASLGYLGDDFILLSADDEPTAHGLYRSAKVNASTLPWLRDVPAEIANGDRLAVEKALLLVRPAGAGHPGPLPARVPLRAILLPRVTGGRDTGLIPVPAMTALRRILPDTLFTSLGSAQVTASGLRRLVRRLPCYELGLGRDLGQIPATIRGLLARA